MKRMVESEIADILNEKLQIDENGIDLKDDLHVDGKISGKEIIEDMSGYSVVKVDTAFIPIYVGVCKNGNKLTIVYCGEVVGGTTTTNNGYIMRLYIPENIGKQLTPFQLGTTQVLDIKKVDLNASIVPSSKNFSVYIEKNSDAHLVIVQYGINSASLSEGTSYKFRYEATFLLSENLAPAE